MANIRKGLKRIIWILSICSLVVSWISLFSSIDFRNRKSVNEPGVAFVKWLDGHYFSDIPRISPTEFEKRESYKNIIGNLMSIIEESVKPDSANRWPYAWEWDPNRKELRGFDIEAALASIRWQERLRKALQINIEKIKSTFPDIDEKHFFERYDIGMDSLTHGNYERHFLPDSYFKIEYHWPIGQIMLAILIGFVPFVVIWIIYFLVDWVVRGFAG